MQEITSETRDGVAAQTFQGLVKDYQSSASLFRKRFMTEILPILGHDSELGKSAARIVKALIKAKILDNEQLERMKAEVNKPDSHDNQPR